ncbi:uncharacterized protein L203_105912 [Cryptococcus depauperatus CBS 7841]|uniref:Uncharacterized protein n=1 Tax=Cryptococcus depauperatus CBS 7841 TaxID=1295531 RepID=A0AAJ8M2Z0_9TREE
MVLSIQRIVKALVTSLDLRDPMSVFTRLHLAVTMLHHMSTAATLTVHGSPWDEWLIWSYQPQFLISRTFLHPEARFQFNSL